MKDQSKEHAKSFFKSQGFSVEEISESKEKRADLSIKFGNEEYVLEAKLREPHGEWSNLVAESNVKGIAYASREVVPWNAISSTITNAYKQLLSTPVSGKTFRLLWVVALKGDEDFVTACFEKRIIGTRLLISINPSEPTKGPTIECHHYSENDFERCELLDAAIVGSRSEFRLLINYYASRKTEFRKSQLYRLFKEKNAVVDPEELESSGKSLFIGKDFLVPRDGKSQWEYLLKKYGLKTSVMFDHQFEGMISLPINKEKEK